MAQDFKLPKTGGTASIDILSSADLGDVLALQEQTRASLPDEQKMFVLPQPKSYFQNLLEQKNGSMIGIRTDGQLVSQMVLMGAMSIEAMVDQQKLTRNEVDFHHTNPGDTVVIAKSMAVHPDWRGNELSQHMLDAVLNLPMARAVDHMFAQVSVENVRSWELFLRKDFGIVAAAVDPGDHKARFILQKPTLGFATHHMQAANGIDPAADFPAIMRLTQREALIGQMDKLEPFKLSFHASVEMAAVWNDEVSAAQ